jgi:hypothetical protein
VPTVCLRARTCLPSFQEAPVRHQHQVLYRDAGRARETTLVGRTIQSRHRLVPSSPHGQRAGNPEPQPPVPQPTAARLSQKRTVRRIGRAMVRENMVRSLRSMIRLLNFNPYHISAVAWWAYGLSVASRREGRGSLAFSAQKNQRPPPLRLLPTLTPGLARGSVRGGAVTRRREHGPWFKCASIP